MENFLDDVEFMLSKKAGIYWRLCWCIIIPITLITIFIYTLIEMEPLTYGDVELPASAHAAGWTLMALGVSQIPIWMLVALFKNRKLPAKNVSLGVG